MVPQGKKHQKKIVSCGNFPNFPLIGSRVCIKYNIVIAMRQLSCPIWEKPKDDDVNELIFYNGGTMHRELLRRIICAWEKVHTKENELKRKNTTTKESYTEWVKEMVQLVKLPFFIDPTYCSHT